MSGDGFIRSGDGGTGLSSPFFPGLAREAVRAYFSRGLGSPLPCGAGWGGAGRCAERFPVLLSGAGRPAPGDWRRCPVPGPYERFARFCRVNSKLELTQL